MEKNARWKKVADFFRMERKKLSAYVRSLINDTIAYEGEDIVQDVMLNILDRADITAPVQNLSGYVYQALRHRVVDLMRKRKETVPWDEAENVGGPAAPSLVPDERVDAAEALEEEEEYRLLFQALRQLPEPDQRIIMATEFEGRTFAELSREWETPIGTLLARKSRAIKKIQEIISEDLR
jgi:RNA polymerase sigma factor (sigma-70 family)